MSSTGSTPLSLISSWDTAMLATAGNQDLSVLLTPSLRQPQPPRLARCCRAWDEQVRDGDRRRQLTASSREWPPGMALLACSSLFRPSAVAAPCHPLAPQPALHPAARRGAGMSWGCPVHPLSNEERADRVTVAGLW